MRARGITRARKRGREDERPKTSARNVRATGKRALSPGAAHSHACERCACPCRPAAAARLPRRFGPDRHSWDGGTGESAVRPGLTYIRPRMTPKADLRYQEALAQRTGTKGGAALPAQPRCSCGSPPDAVANQTAARDGPRRLGGSALPSLVSKGSGL